MCVLFFRKFRLFCLVFILAHFVPLKEAFFPSFFQNFIVPHFLLVTCTNRQDIFFLQGIYIAVVILDADVGLNRTSRPVGKSGKFSKFGLSGNRTFSLPDARLLTLLKIEKKTSKFFFFKFLSGQETHMPSPVEL